MRSLAVPEAVEEEQFGEAGGCLNKLLAPAGDTYVEHWLLGKAACWGGESCQPASAAMKITAH